MRKARIKWKVNICKQVSSPVETAFLLNLRVPMQQPFSNLVAYIRKGSRVGWTGNCLLSMKTSSLVARCYTWKGKKDVSIEQTRDNCLPSPLPHTHNQPNNSLPYKLYNIYQSYSKTEFTSNLKKKKAFFEGLIFTLCCLLSKRF